MSIATRITAIQEHLENVYDKLEDLGIDLTNVDKNIDNISTMLEEVYDEYPKVTGTGTEVTLNNTKAGKMNVDLKGKTSQGSTTGKNIWINEIENGEASNGITVTKKEDGTLIFNGTATAQTMFYFVKSNSTGKYLEVNQQYTLSGVKNTNTALSNACILGGIGNSSTSDIYTYSPGHTREITKDNSFIRFASGTILNNYIIKPMLNTGSTAEPYEKYTRRNSKSKSRLSTNYKAHRR